MRNGAKAAIMGGVFAVMVGGAGYGAYNIVSAVTATAARRGPRRRRRPGRRGRTRSRRPPRASSRRGSQGDASAAALHTNNASVAEPLLAGYADEAHVTKAMITPGTAVGTNVPYTVKATVSYDGKTKPLAYKAPS